MHASNFLLVSYEFLPNGLLPAQRVLVKYQPSICLSFTALPWKFCTKKVTAALWRSAPEHFESCTNLLSKNVPLTRRFERREAVNETSHLHQLNGSRSHRQKAGAASVRRDTGRMTMMEERSSSFLLSPFSDTHRMG